MAQPSETKILVADAEIYVRESIKFFLADYGYQVHEAASGKEALAIFEKDKPDIVLCDLNMPEMNGFQILARIEAVAPDTPVIVISGAANIADTVDALRLGAWDYIVKPMQDMMVLFHAIDKCLERSQLIKDKAAYQKGLEVANAQLKISLETLEKTRDQLVQSEKMAALGGLVAGVAHEINTPVGVGITAASFMKDRTDAIASLFKSEALKKSDLESYLQTMAEVSHSILMNMERAASLIKSFKQMAVDQVIEEKRTFNLKQYLGDLLISLKPSYRHRTGITLTMACSESLQIESFPGVLSQIFTNLVMNSLHHGFNEMQEGEIKIEASAEDAMLCIVYSDSGCGMTQEQIEKVFDPFFTTARTKGGTGLGMSIVYNLVTQTLGGTISCQSVYGRGVTFEINIPQVVVES